MDGWMDGWMYMLYRTRVNGMCADRDLVTGQEACTSPLSSDRNLEHCFNTGSQCCHCTSLAPFTALFTARCSIVQSAVLRSHVVRPSVRLSVYNVGGSGPHRSEIF